MKVMVTYMSLSGNTKKIGEAIFGEILEEKEIKVLNEIDDLGDYDLAFVGFPIHGYGVPEEVGHFLKKYCLDKQIALFVTHGAPEESKDLQPWLVKCQEAAAGADVIGMFNCQGELAQYVIDELLKNDDPRIRSWGEHGPSTRGQPDATRVEKARIFAREVMERIKE